MKKGNRASVTRSTGPLVAEKDRAAIEARNALIQFDAVRRLARARLGKFFLTPQDICDLQGLAVQGVYADAGKLRQIAISISNSPHTPPAWQKVPKLVGKMCDYASGKHESPLHVPAYLMWRLNWIHPFADGNGRTSRAISYLALCCNLELDLPGTITVPELITNNKTPYYDALDAADLAWTRGEVDVSLMETLISDHLITQLGSS